jgi:hypothetical protein
MWLRFDVKMKMKAFRCIEYDRHFVVYVCLYYYVLFVVMIVCRSGRQKWWIMLKEQILRNKLILAKSPELQCCHLIAKLWTNQLT